MICMVFRAPHQESRERSEFLRWDVSDTDSVIVTMMMGINLTLTLFCSESTHRILLAVGRMLFEAKRSEVDRGKCLTGMR